ncbi:MAG: hypothetical protein ACK4N4_15725 [Burkholderiales bacterium]
MTPSASRHAFEAAARSVAEAFSRAGPFPGQEVTPPLLIAAITQCLDIVAGDDGSAGVLPAEDIGEIGTHALECVSDLALWAYQLGLEAERAEIENLALDFGLWIARNGGVIAVIEPVVNALARRANSSASAAALTELAGIARELVDHADPASAASGEPWHILNFNLAIIATRTQKPELMHAAYDLLERNLPRECAAFYEEGLRQAGKEVYGPQVREIMRERFTKWTTRH